MFFFKKKNLDEIALNYNFTYLLSDIQSPLGLTVGNSLEVEESLACLRGGGPHDLRELVMKGWNDTDDEGDFEDD